MSNELVKWSGGKLVKSPSPVEKCRQAREAALALLRPAPVLPARSRDAESAVVVSAKPGEIVDLPRVCAVHDRPYAARYIRGDDGLLRRGPMIELTETLWMRQYAGNGAQRLILSPGGIVLSDETCPWCGASGFSAIRCGKCGFEICYGRTTGRFFRCRLSCGKQGAIRWDVRASEGVTPDGTRGGGFAMPTGR